MPTVRPLPRRRPLRCRRTPPRRRASTLGCLPFQGNDLVGVNLDVVLVGQAQTERTEALELLLGCPVIPLHVSYTPERTEALELLLGCPVIPCGIRD